LVWRRAAAAGRAETGPEAPGQTLDATAFWCTAYRAWSAATASLGRAAPTSAARRRGDARILVESARRKRRLKHGGGLARAAVEPAEIPAPETRSFDELLAIDAVLDRLTVIDPSAAELVKLRYFAGFSIVQAAEILGISPRSADRLWTYARAWLRREIEPE
jgi:DNA-directed RNA polymerase specialized sigma24 family protein